MEKITMLKVNYEPQHLLRGELTVELEIQAQDFMTVQENEEYQSLIGRAIEINSIAILRMLAECKSNQ